MAMNACPACGRPIAAEDINIKEGVGLCRACGTLSRLSEIADQPLADATSLAKPPKGCWYEQQMGGGGAVYASLRSPGTAIGTLAVCLFWNGIVSVFVLVALSGLYTHFFGRLPPWFPAPGAGGSKSSSGGGNSGSEMSLGMTLFLCLFLTPFVIIGIGMFLAFLMSLLGRVEVVVSMGSGCVRTGFGPFNWTRRFDASKVKRVKAGQTSYAQNGRYKQLIQIESEDRTVSFGSTLRDQRREWMLGVLHLLLVANNKKGTRPLAAASVLRT